MDPKALSLYRKLIERIEVYTGARETDESFEDLAKDLLLTDDPDGIRQYKEAPSEVQKIPEIREAYLKLQEVISKKRKRLIKILAISDS